MQKVRHLNFLEGGVTLLELPVSAVDGNLHKLLLDKTLSVAGSAADAAAVGAEIEKISKLIDSKAQLVPEFANSVDECTDTSKVYVLPDGYIYAYTAKNGELFTNQIKNAIDIDGEPYNDGLGYKKGWRIGANFNGTDDATFGVNGYADDRPNGAITGLIPYDPSTIKKIRVSGFKTNYDSDCYIAFYDENFRAFNDQRGRISYYVESYNQTYEDESAFDGAVKTFTFDLDTFSAATNWYSEQIKNKAKYVAFSISNVDTERLVVTFDEEIAFGTNYAWRNTGHAFVPADYEDRIIPLENKAEDHESRIKSLELYGIDSVSSEDIPVYIKTEADAALARLLKVQGNRSFNKEALSDFHYGGQGDNKDNLIRASKAISYMQNRIHIDAIATLGDNLPYGAAYDDNMRTTADRWLKEINEILTITQRTGVLDFRTPGNHDRFGTTELYMPDNAIYSLISGYNRKCDYVNAPIGYAYYDFDSYKLRVIVLNTVETEGKGRFSENSGYHIGNKQYEWIIKTLDMSDKEDADEWQILTLSHHRPDDWQKNTDNPSNYSIEYILPNILNAYKTGGSYSANISSENISVQCNFGGKNQARLIGSIHGHHHNYKYSCLRLGDANSGLSDIMAIGTPTTSFGVDKNADNAGNTYTNIKDTAQETAFCLYSIDLDNHVVHAIHYGVGCDREVNY